MASPKERGGSDRQIGREGPREFMSNFEVLLVNALVFSLLRLGRQELEALMEATDELVERDRLFNPNRSSRAHKTGVV
eukprot:CAMPEP_0185782040 /NCGR_PEP_ID=MMETSP1174-20130828/106046_1 /TAXON_ID=35687 /ORGANISM="Dictyocha speculum, Strain CCMP1381" /LENGTH=77 /DNA_ID=CAMNT_0028472321 /DNA_START=38 /DNA_END=271 /DNA_ORIENTATION=+